MAHPRQDKEKEVTNYNDGNWHGWNGGEYPVHPKSKVEVVIGYPDGLVRSSAGSADSFRWGHLEGDTNIIAFRVVKEHREPREFWLCDGEAFLSEGSAAVKQSCTRGGKIIHVREVLE